MVEDAYQQRGLGCQLLLRLVAYAQQQGFSSIIANISAENQAVQATIRHTGLPAEYHYVGCGEYQVIVSLATASGHRTPSPLARPARSGVRSSVTWVLLPGSPCSCASHSPKSGMARHPDVQIRTR